LGHGPRDMEQRRPWRHVLHLLVHEYMDSSLHALYLSTSTDYGEHFGRRGGSCIGPNYERSIRPIREPRTRPFQYRNSPLLAEIVLFFCSPSPRSESRVRFWEPKFTGMPIFQDQPQAASTRHALSPAHSSQPERKDLSLHARKGARPKLAVLSSFPNRTILEHILRPERPADLFQNLQ
jgi:hypothetical protein